MKRASLLLSVAVIAGWLIWLAVAAQPTAEGVIRQMLDTYRNLKTYEEMATETQRVKQGEQERTVTIAHRFAYKAPNKFYYDFQQQGKTVAVGVCDGKTLLFHFIPRNQGMKAEAPADMTNMEGLLERMGLRTQLDPLAFLIGDDPLANGGKATIIKEDTVDGKPTYQIEVTNPERPKVTLWIGKTDHLLYKTHQVITGTVRGQPVTITVTETHTEMKVNPDLSETAFAYQPPKDAVMETLNVLVGKPAPPFKLTDLDGKEVELAKLKGKVVVLNFWAFW